MGNIKVDIFGNEYIIKGDVAPDYIKEIAGYVNGKMHEISGGFANVSPLKAAVLTALNIADELQQLKGESAEKKEELARRVGGLIGMIDEALTEDRPNNRW